MKDLSDIAAPGNSGLPWTILGTRSPQQYWLAGAQVPADADLDAFKALVAPIVDRVNEVKRVDGGRVD